MTAGLRLVVEGNDGTGKSTLVAALRERGFDAVDRGLPTKMTDDDTLQDDGLCFYLILDSSVEVCRERLGQAGKDLSEQYHTAEDLAHYRRRYEEVARRLRHRAVIDSGGSPARTLAAALSALDEAGLAPTAGAGTNA